MMNMYKPLPDGANVPQIRPYRRHHYFGVGVLVLGFMFACSVVLRWSRIDVSSAHVVLLGFSQLGALVTGDRYDVFKYLQGWTREEFLECTFNPPPCPQPQLEFPIGGCSFEAPRRRLLLTASGLSSEHMQEAFRTMMQAAAEARGGTHDTESKRVLLVLDGAYAAYRDGTQHMSSQEYCAMRKKELVGLGASHVICVILDPAARAHEWKAGKSNSSLKAFGDAMHEIDDDYILHELHLAVAVFVEVGSPMPLMAAMRRKLNLKDSAGDPGLSFGDAVRARVLDGSGEFLYVGASSGSTIAGEDLSFLQDPAADLLDGDLSGLRLVANCSFFPHVTPDQGPMLQQIALRSHSGMMGIPNCNPVVDWGQLSGLRLLNYDCA